MLCLAPGAHLSWCQASYAYAAGSINQLDHLAALQLLAGYTAPAPKMPVWNDPSASVSDRARAYLDVNCASCHNSAGRSGNTGLWLGLGVTEPLRLGVCKPPVGGQQNRQFSYDVTPGDADASFLSDRLNSYRPNSEPQRVAMPELGRHVFHAEGNAPGARLDQRNGSRLPLMDRGKGCQRRPEPGLCSAGIGLP